MAGRPPCICDQQQCILIAINPDLTNPKNIARSLTLFPKSTAGTRMKMCLPTCYGSIERLLVHVSEHQDRVVACINDNCSQQTIRTELWRKYAAILPLTRCQILVRQSATLPNIPRSW